MAQRLHFLLSALALFGVACSDGAGEETSGQTSGQTSGPPDACASVICDNPPTASCPDPTSLSTWASPGVCTDGECSYTPTVELCPFGCEIDACLPDPCLTVVCSDPPAPECDDADTLRTYAANGTCVASECEYQSSTSLCEHGCDSGACAPDPCLAIAAMTSPSWTPV